MFLRTTRLAVAVLLAVLLTLAGCSSGSSKASSGASPGGTGTTVHITIKDGKVTPNGDRIKASVGKPITLHIEADSAGQIHVHSTPEQEIDFPKGTSTQRLTIDQPGVVDVEDHALDQVIVQLQVS
jgi:PBP1b-binding outer membrane lipoprotein LpoB